MKPRRRKLTLESARAATFKESESLKGSSCIKIEGYDFNQGVYYSELLRSMVSTGLQASNLGDAIGVYDFNQGKQCFGWGGFRRVYKTQFNDNVLAAIKRLKGLYTQFNDNVLAAVKRLKGGTRMLEENLRKLTYIDMNRREDAGRRLYEACWSGSVPALDSLIEEDQFILERASSLTGFFDDTPLHLATLRGHLDFTKALLTRKPKLASELDSLRCSPLHLASAEGHVEVVQELLRVNTGACVARDQDGRIPLHLAAMKGRVEIIHELLGAKPNSIHEKLRRRETVFHLCVKYNRLEALKALVQYVQSNDMEALLNSRDDDGNTILHLAAALKQMDTIEYLLGITSVKNHASVKNQNGSTAFDVVEHCPDRDLKTMEIRELLLQAGVRTSIRGGLDPNPESPPVNPPRPQRCGKPGAKLKGCICSFWKYIKVDRDWLQQAGVRISIRGKLGPNPESPPDNPPHPRSCCKPGVIFMRSISRFWIKYIKVDRVWLQEVRGHLLMAATLTATMAYQSILSPPGGLWQDSDKAGRAILDSETNSGYKANLVVNTIVLLASLSTIMLAMTGFPISNKLVTWLLIFTVYVTIGCMAAAYVIALILVSPEVWDSSWTVLGSPDLVVIMFLGCFCLCAFLGMANEQACDCNYNHKNSILFEESVDLIDLKDHEDPNSLNEVSMVGYSISHPLNRVKEVATSDARSLADVVHNSKTKDIDKWVTVDDEVSIENAKCEEATDSKNSDCDKVDLLDRKWSG
ncbi:hypothetical protein Vadar_028122 [Vaccinium darrowii]|uniref:Uncharacterized protein n=1 Tax=Vaccinium darrowii TaxID=229202 RepID=A0ACB7YZ42_9ERIC|nr:hypothetical protein Vadar_028122 [Vaccinium darrowii]